MLGPDPQTLKTNKQPRGLRIEMMEAQRQPSNCGICQQSKPRPEIFNVMRFCTHTFCTTCINLYVASKLPETNTTSIRCPNPICDFGLLDLESCRAVVVPELIDDWEFLLGTQSTHENFSVAYCSICMESKPMPEIFSAMKFCSHTFCNGCIGMYVTTKVSQNSVFINCPDQDCNGGMLEVESCREVVEPEVIVRWEQAICENTIDAKFYCPFEDCSVMLADERGELAAIREAECPHCHRLFCARCQVPWHAGETCEKFGRNVGKEKKGWFQKLVEKYKNSREAIKILMQKRVGKSRNDTRR